MTEPANLFDGTTLAGWAFKTRRDGAWIPASEHNWTVVADARPGGEENRELIPQAGIGAFANGARGRTADIHTTIEHGSCELHVEFLIPAKSNSGVYLMGQYEIQVVDSYGLADCDLKSGSCGGIYARWVEETKLPYDGHPPLLNASQPSGEWQSFDVTFHGPRFDGYGRKIANARFERVLFNGTLIHRDVECTGPTRGSWKPIDVARGPLRLQGDHGPVAYRNVRMRQLD
ncbi:MAG: DUF1080 domain-containing protein [Chloroflexota bacterium]|nr:MAG: DUF1080 domain-containing protein [Chloroflexota bacterium]